MFGVGLIEQKPLSAELWGADAASQVTLVELGAVFVSPARAPADNVASTIDRATLLMISFILKVSGTLSPKRRVPTGFGPPRARGA